VVCEPFDIDTRQYNAIFFIGIDYENKGRAGASDKKSNGDIPVNIKYDFPNRFETLKNLK